MRVCLSAEAPYLTQVAEDVAVDGKDSKVFANPKYGSSNWFMPLSYHGDAEVCFHSRVCVWSDVLAALCSGRAAWPPRSQGIKAAPECY